MDKTTQRVECGPSVVWHARIEVVEQQQDPSRDIRRDLRKRDELVKCGGDAVLPGGQQQLDSVQPSLLATCSTTITTRL